MRPDRYVKPRPLVSNSEHEIWLRIRYADIGWIERGARFADGSKHRHGVAQLRPLHPDRFAWRRRPYGRYRCRWSPSFQGARYVFTGGRYA